VNPLDLEARRAQVAGHDLVRNRVASDRYELDCCSLSL
jgi:hypothetical protein